MEQTLNGRKSTSVPILLSFSAAARLPFPMSNNLFSSTAIDTGSAIIPLLTKFLFSKVWTHCRPILGLHLTSRRLVYRTIANKVFWEFDCIIMENLSNISLLFCTPTCPPHHVSATQEYFKFSHQEPWE